MGPTRRGAALLCLLVMLSGCTEGGPAPGPDAMADAAPAGPVGVEVHDLVLVLPGVPQPVDQDGPVRDYVVDDLRPGQADRLEIEVLTDLERDAAASLDGVAERQLALAVREHLPDGTTASSATSGVTSVDGRDGVTGTLEWTDDDTGWRVRWLGVFTTDGAVIVHHVDEGRDDDATFAALADALHEPSLAPERRVALDVSRRAAP